VRDKLSESLRKNLTDFKGFVEPPGRME